MTPSFSDPAMIANYVESTPRKVPGLIDLHRMAMLLLAERVPASANILVVGAGGGMELKAFATDQPHWHFVGVDPSAEMLSLALHVLGPLSARVQFQQGFVETAPPGPFHGATCLLTLHFLSKDERLRTLLEIRRRLIPGAPFVVAHHSGPDGGDLHRWLSRSAAFANKSTVDFASAFASATAMADCLPVLSAQEDESLLRAAGFSDIALFYAGFSFRGWIATA